MFFWLGVVGAVLGAIYIVRSDNKDDFWLMAAFWVVFSVFYCNVVWLFCNKKLKNFWYNMWNSKNNGEKSWKR